MKESSPNGSLGKICDLFPDESMALTVRDACGKFSINQEVTAEELSSIKKLEPSAGQKIKNLTGIGYLTGLTSVRLDWGRGEFEDFPDDMRNCTELMFLDIQSIGLKRLPEWIGELSQLWRIDANGNDIAILPDSICNLTKLRELNLGSNTNLSKLPDNIGNLASLESLSIAYTSITELPESIYALNLKEINMAGLPIK